MQFLFSGDSIKLGKTKIKSLHWSEIETFDFARFSEKYYSLISNGLPSIKLDYWPKSDLSVLELNASSGYSQFGHIRGLFTSLELALLMKKPNTVILRCFWKSFCDACVRIFEPARVCSERDHLKKRKSTVAAADVFYSEIEAIQANVTMKNANGTVETWFESLIDFFFKADSDSKRSNNDMINYMKALIDVHWKEPIPDDFKTELMRAADYRLHTDFKWGPKISQSKIFLNEIVSFTQSRRIVQETVISQHINSKAGFSLTDEGIMQLDSFVIKGLNKRVSHLAKKQNYGEIIHSFDIRENYRDRIIFVIAMLFASKHQETLSGTTKARFETILYITILFFKIHERTQNEISIFRASFKNYKLTKDMLVTQKLFAYTYNSNLHVVRLDFKTQWANILKKWNEFNHGFNEDFLGIAIPNPFVKGEPYVNLNQIHDYMRHINDEVIKINEAGL
jgi:hypothetical protein